MPESPTVPDEAIAGDSRVIDPEQFDELIRGLNERFDVRGPVLSHDAIVLGPLRGARDLPIGWHDEQAPGHYRVRDDGDDEYFGFAVGPSSVKAQFLPPHQVQWRSEGRGEHLKFVEATPAPVDLAFVGVRPCDVAALDVLAQVLVGGEYPDPRVVNSRRGLFVAVVDCARPAATCFCSSMGTGPDARGGYDLAITELFAPHRFLVRLGSERGRREMATVASVPATDHDWDERRATLAAAEARLTRHVDTRDLATFLEGSIDHPRWRDIAERCLSCANCTMACPTCFCTDVRDVTDIDGDTERQRSWSSCFDLNYSFVHGGPVRSSTSSRYRQWLTHKFSTWWEQFGSSGCVGCGRCVTWCPVGIDVTAELAALRAASASEASPGVATR